MSKPHCLEPIDPAEYAQLQYKGNTARSHVLHAAFNALSALHMVRKIAPTSTIVYDLEVQRNTRGTRIRLALSTKNITRTRIHGVRH